MRTLRQLWRLSGTVRLSFPVSGIRDAALRTGRALFAAIGFTSRAVGGIRVRWPILRKTIRFVAVRSLRKVMAVAIGMRVGDNKSAVRTSSISRHRTLCGNRRSTAG